MSSFPLTTYDKILDLYLDPDRIFINL